ncbi:MAG: holo-ACP synthase [Candidatus Wallbacteria bacterium]|nr:holo-ACP synthase [Candidatus Wallbacteria bacterium]
MRDMLERHGARLRHKLFTPGEQLYCDDHGEPHRPQHYAARFAAKEAWIKASGIAIAWKEIEVVNRPGTGVPDLVLHGETAAAARRAGIRRVLLTITHAGELAVAQVTVLGARP